MRFKTLSYAVSSSFLFLLLCLTQILLTVSITQAQWITKSNAAANGEDAASYHNPGYNVFFLGTPQPLSGGNPTGMIRSSADVLTFNLPEPQQYLYVFVAATGEVKQLFPRVGVDEGIVDAPLADGAALEPDIDQAGDTLYFTWVHDADNDNGEHGNRRGADIYSIELGSNPNFNNINSFVVKRLTDNSGDQADDPERLADATNPRISDKSKSDWGNFDIGPTPITGPNGEEVLVWASDRAREMNSNRNRGPNNRAYYIYMADIEDDGSLSNVRRAHYFTTTSGVTPERYSKGFALAYQATTLDTRNWQIQGSGGDHLFKWFPIANYNGTSGVAHNSTYCRKTTSAQDSAGYGQPGDVHIYSKYYNQFNNGFGDLRTIHEQDFGINVPWDPSTGVKNKKFTQKEYEVTIGVPSGDTDVDPALGKFATPYCGRPDELIASHSLGGSNLREGKGFFPYIAFIDGLDPFDPLTDKASASNPNGALRKLVTNRLYYLTFPVPQLNWSERTGGVYTRQPVPGVHKDPQTVVPSGMPWGLVGTSHILNTDIVTADCRLTDHDDGADGTLRFDGAHADGDGSNGELSESIRDTVYKNGDMLTELTPDLPGFLTGCAPPSSAFGIEIRYTSQETNNRKSFAGPGYITDMQEGILETHALLGVAKVKGQVNSSGQPDWSFLAMIPANVPFEFSLLADDGLTLANVRSWHSLKPGETRNDCGGCHNHREGEGIPFAGTYADVNRDEPVNMVTETPYIVYDANCNPQIEISDKPAIRQPIWEPDIYPGFDQHCGDCHNSGRSSDNNALGALSYTNSSNAYTQLTDKTWIHEFGAKQSAACWAAMGKRMDGRTNNMRAAGSDTYADLHASGDTVNYHSPHAGLCDGTNLAGAQWAFEFCRWIDLNAPSGVGVDEDKPEYGADFDRYPPTVDGALTDASCTPSQLLIGYWDDTDTIKELTIEVNGTQVQSYSNLTNGFVLHDISTLSSEDKISVKAVDPVDNQQKYTKTVAELVVDCTGVPPVPVPDDDEDGDGVSDGDDSEDGGDGDKDGSPDGGPESGDGSPDLLVSNSSPQPCDVVTFTVQDAPEFGRMGVLVSASTNEGFDFYGVPMQVDADQYANASSSLFVRNLDDTGGAEVSIVIPRQLSVEVKDITFNAQAFVQDENAAAREATNLVTFKITGDDPPECKIPVKNKKLKKKIKKERKKARKFKKALKRAKSKRKIARMTKRRDSALDRKAFLKSQARGRKLFGLMDLPDPNKPRKRPPLTLGN